MKCKHLSRWKLGQHNQASRVGPGCEFRKRADWSRHNCAQMNSTHSNAKFTATPNRVNSLKPNRNRRIRNWTISDARTSVTLTRNAPSLHSTPHVTSVDDTNHFDDDILNLEPQNNRPDETKYEAWISIDNIFSTNIFERNLQFHDTRKTFKEPNETWHHLWRHSSFNTWAPSPLSVLQKVYRSWLSILLVIIPGLWELFISCLSTTHAFVFLILPFSQ